jgi:two-component system chemotaxis sensor kinase CheA
MPGDKPHHAVDDATLAADAEARRTLLRRFADEGLYTLQEAEAALLAPETGDSETKQQLQRLCHGLKDEAGALELDDVAQVCHAIESALGSPTSHEVAEMADRLLEAHRWLCRALAAHADGRQPEPCEPILARLAGDQVGATVLWDDEDRAVVGEFLSESADSLTAVDELLLDADQSGLEKNSVDTLFRAFHTIKGVAGCYELTQVVAVAHSTETLLDAARNEFVAIEGEVLDLVFAATAKMRELLAVVRAAAEGSRFLAAVAGVDSLVVRLGAATAGPAIDVDVSRASAAGDQDHQSSDTPITPSAKPPVAKNSSARREATPASPAPLSPSNGSVPRSARAGIDETVRVPVNRLDTLVEMVSELVIVESMVAHAPEIAVLTSPRVRNSLRQLTKITRDLQDNSMRMRMVPLRGLFQKMARMVRDLAHKSGKSIKLDLVGEWTEMDRNMVERIADPLVHLIRNAVDHGIETPEERAQVGKASPAIICLSAEHEGGNVAIELRDDGRGLNRDAIVRKAVERGLVEPGAPQDDAQVAELIFAPGFSTARAVTEVSGRGVGMDVVRRNVESLRGRVQVSSTPGRGTTFRMLVPLTLAIIDGMVVACGHERYIVPTLSIVESIEPEPSMLSTIGGRRQVVRVRREVLPLLSLPTLLGVDGGQCDPMDCVIVIVESLGRKIAVLVHQVVKQQHVVIKSLELGFENTSSFAGAAILPDGRVGLILNVDELCALAERSDRLQRRQVLHGQVGGSYERLAVG